MKPTGTYFIPVLLVLISLPASSIELSFPVQSGNHQYQLVDFELPEPIRVRVIDSIGNPVEGVEVFFRIAETPGKAGGFHCSPARAITNEDGIASARVTLGPESGQYQVLARIQGDVATDTILFSFHA